MSFFFDTLHISNLATSLPGLGPVALFFFFLLASLGMIWRLERLEQKGFEGTVLGTLIMPYCSGFPNLVFAWLMIGSPDGGGLVLENCIVNNVTNLTLIIGLCAVLAKPPIKPIKSGKKKHASQIRLNRLSLLFTLIAALFFTGAVWALGRDQVLDLGDGLALAGIFVFWQVTHVFEVLKTNVRQNRRFSATLLLDIFIIGAGAWGVYFSTEELVAWVTSSGQNLFDPAYLGWFSGFLMVLPNALLAAYYAAGGRQEVVYSSQIGDGHICIPMCIGLFALFQPMAMPGFFENGVYLIIGAVLLHFFFILILGRLPRWAGFLLMAGYGGFLVDGLMA